MMRSALLIDIFVGHQRCIEAVLPSERLLGTVCFFTFLVQRVHQFENAGHCWTDVSQGCRWAQVGSVDAVKVSIEHLDSCRNTCVHFFQFVSDELFHVQTLS